MAWTWRVHNNVLSDSQLVIAVREPELSDLWQWTVSADEVNEVYRDWPPHLAKVINEVCNRLFNSIELYY